MSACVYRMYADNGALLYVGCSTRLDSRVRKHETSKPWWSEVARIEIDHFDSQAEALAAEASLIERLRPRHSVPSSASARRASVTRVDRQRAFHAFGQQCQVCNCLHCRRVEIDKAMDGRLRDVLYKLRVDRALGLHATAQALRRAGFPRATTSFVDHCCQHYGITAELAAS